jgi:hypothetical protein
MKPMTFIAAIGLTSALLALDAVAAQPGRPDAFTRGIDVTKVEPARAAVTALKTAAIGRPEALTRGMGVGALPPATDFATKLTPEQKPGKPEYHTRGIYCPHRGKRS